MSTAALERARPAAARGPAVPEALRRHVGGLLAAYRSEPEIPECGDYRTLQIGPWLIFILRRDDGSIAAFHNTCRHRGSRILQQDAAHSACSARRAATNLSA